MKPCRGRPLAHLLTLAFTGLLAGALALMALGTYALVSRHLRHAADHQLRLALTTACEGLPGARLDQDLLVLPSSEAAQILVDAVADRDHPVRYLEGDRLLAQAGGEGLGPPPHPHPGHHPPPPRLFHYRPWPVRVNDTVVGRLETGVDLRPPHDLLAALARTLFITGVLAWLAGLWVCHRLARFLNRSLQPVLTTVERVAGGDLTARVDSASNVNEFNALGQHVSAMAERLQANFAAQERFVADASHELRTPLTAIGAMAEMLEGELDPEKTRRAASTIVRESERMTRLVNDLLALSRAEPETAAGDLATTVQQVIEEFRVIHPERDIRFTDGPAIAGPATAWYSIVRNLLENALRYSDKEVQVELRQDVLEVRDHGCGIAPEDLPRVKDRFYRADRSRQRATGGAGLGLSIVEALAHQIGARVEIESQLGEGTTVKVFLPR